VTATSTAPVGPAIPLAYNERSLLELLYERGKPGVYHKRELDHASFEEVAQDAGLGTVGEASTMTRPAMEFRQLEARGYVERVKDVEGALRYRVTQLGERAILTGRLREAEQASAAAIDLGRKRQARSLEGKLAAARAELEAWRKLPRWRRAFGEPNAVEIIEEQNRILDEEVDRA
jgi:DNA-binding MarR family transcriptional regulator